MRNDLSYLLEVYGRLSEIEGGHVWAERYDRELTDLFAPQDDVTQQIVTALQVQLTAGEQERRSRAPTDNLAAYDYYWRGVEYYYRRTQEANVQARELFARAITLDAAFAAAYVLLGRTYLTEWAVGWSNNPQSVERACTAGTVTRRDSS